MKQTYSAGGVIINSNNEVLLVNEGDGFWGFPKGRVEAGEETLAAALREIKEETGFTKLKLLKELGLYQRHPVNAGIEDSSELKNITIYLFKTTQEIPPTNDENNECAWFSINTALTRLSHSKDKEFLERAMTN